jgi:hypothetical protein
MALVPAEMAIQTNMHMHTPAGPALQQLSLLDQQMKTVLDDYGLSPEMKLYKYYSTLNRYETLQDSARNTPVPVQVTGPVDVVRKPLLTAATTAAQTELSEPLLLPAGEEELLDQIPARQQKNARLLLKYVKESPEMKWNQNRELVYKGMSIPGSNIFDLISDTTRNHKGHPATGWQQFTEGLMKQNIPEQAVGNKERWRYILGQRVGNEEDVFETPTVSSGSGSGSGGKLGRKKRYVRKPVTPLISSTPVRGLKGTRMRFGKLY